MSPPTDPPHRRSSMPPPNVPIEGSMSGALMTTGREVTKELIGVPAYERALASVPRHVADEYRAVTPMTWVPLSIIEPVIHAMGDASGRDALDLQDEVSRITVDRSLRTIWRMFLRFTSNEALISRMPIIFSKSFNKGRIVTSFPRPEKAIIELLDWPNAPAHVVRGTRVGLETTLKAAGRHTARVSFERTRGGALYTAAGLR
jgi:hypothetical protein